MIGCTSTNPHTLLSNVSLVTPMMHLLCNVTKTEQEALHNVARDASSCGIIKKIYQFQVDGRLRKSDSRSRRELFLVLSISFEFPPNHQVCSAAPLFLNALKRPAV